MDRSLSRFVVFHGAIVFWLGLIAGVPFLFIASEQIVGDVRAWRMAHLEGILNGMVAFAGVAIAGHLTIDASKQRLYAWCLVLTGYTNAVASILGALFGVRGLVLSLPIMNLLVFSMFGVGVVTIFLAMGIVVMGARRSA